jgi:hypothetical protein
MEGEMVGMLVGETFGTSVGEILLPSLMKLSVNS